MAFKLGLKPKQIPLKCPILSNFLDRATSWPPVNPRGWEYLVPPDKWGMNGNDVWGDCAEAMANHFIVSTSYNTDHPLSGTDQQVLNFYSAVTGFDPNAGPPETNQTDQGTVLSHMLDVWKTDGFPVTDLTTGSIVTHKILGYAACDITSWAQIRWVTDTFGGCLKGIQCPQSAQQDTSNWTYVANSPIDGGHAILQDSQGGAGDKNISWGMVIPTTLEFELNYMTEAWAVVTESWLNALGTSPSGLNLDGLLAALKEV
jgi:hypothetical protein